MTKASKIQKLVASSTNEYYELPYRYDETIIRILAQTPNTLFVYWDISDLDREKLIKNYGQDFFNKTRPVLIIKNETTNSTFEITVNDFANNWYLEIFDSNCKYSVELGRKSNEFIPNLNTDYVSIVHSNIIEAPNDHVLSANNQNYIYYYNAKTNSYIKKEISQLNFKKETIFSIYKNMELECTHDNPSSSSKIY
jgi:Uncharacterized protein conserved in bacteria